MSEVEAPAPDPAPCNLTESIRASEDDAAWFDPTAAMRAVRTHARARADRARQLLQEIRESAIRRYIEFVEDVPREMVEEKITKLEIAALADEGGARSPVASAVASGSAPGPLPGGAAAVAGPTELHWLPRGLREYMTQFKQLNKEIASAEAEATQAKARALKARERRVSKIVLGYATERDSQVDAAQTVASMAQELTATRMCVEHLVLHAQQQQRQIDKLTSLVEQISAAFTRFTERPSIAVLRRAGMDVAELYDAGFTGTELRAAHFSVRELYEGDLPLQELRDLGYSARDLHGVDSKLSIDDLKAAGYSAQDLCTIPAFTALECLRAGYLQDEVVRADFPAAQFKDAGIPATTIRAAGAAASQMRLRGFSAKQCREAGYTAQELAEGGFTADDLKRSGITAAMLKSSGVKATQMHTIGFSASECEEAGYTIEDLRGVFPVHALLRTSAPGADSDSDEGDEEEAEGEDRDTEE